MKETLDFPLSGLSGSIGAPKKKIYYKWRDLQVSRTYNFPKEPNNPSFRNSQEITKAIARSWKECPDALKYDWGVLADRWWKMEACHLKYMNPWLAFFASNYWRYMYLGHCNHYPPQLPPIIKIKGVTIYGPPHPYLPATMVINLPRFRYEEGYIVVWLYKPYDGFPHARRDCEKHLLYGIHGYSVKKAGDGSDDLVIELPASSIPPQSGQFIWLDVRLISRDWFPHPHRFLNVQAKEGYPVISFGNMLHNYSPGASSGTPPDYCQEWTRSANGLYVQSNKNDEVFLLPLNLIPEFRVVNFSIQWEAPSFSGAGVKLDLVSYDPDAAGSNFSVVKGPYSWTETQATVRRWNYENFLSVSCQGQMPFALRVRTITSGDLVKVYYLGLTTCMRSY